MKFASSCIKDSKLKTSQGGANMNLLEIFCSVDDFCKVFLSKWNKKLIEYGEKKRCRKSRMTPSEIITILIYFHQSKYRDFKSYYLLYIRKYLKKEFPELLSYNRFVALMPTVFVPLCSYLQSRKKKSNGISFIDSTPIIVCHNKRIHGHKVFKNIAARGKSTKGWFYGFKLHLICDHNGELINCAITPGDVDDRTPVTKLTNDLFGKLFGDKGYISKDLFALLFERGLQLITGIRKNMKNKYKADFCEISPLTKGLSVLLFFLSISKS